jgi:signal transduction histidine kinase
MLVNLIENASRHGGPATAIELTVRAEHGSAIITVADNGPGIPPDKREEVFQPFRRLNLDRGTPGAGLGLALVKAVAVRHHARVTLSDNNPGLKVTLLFPPMRAPLPWPERKSDIAAAPARIAAPAATPAEVPQP